MFMPLFDNCHSRLFNDSANSFGLFIKENDRLILFHEVGRFKLLDQFPITFNRIDCHNASHNRNYWK